MRANAFVDYTDEINSPYALVPIIVYCFDKKGTHLADAEIRKMIKWFFYSHDFVCGQTGFLARLHSLDWGTAQVRIGGQWQVVIVFCMRSRYSGKSFVGVYPWERQGAPKRPDRGIKNSNLQLREGCRLEQSILCL